MGPRQVAAITAALLTGLLIGSPAHGAEQATATYTGTLGAGIQPACETVQPCAAGMTCPATCFSGGGFQVLPDNFGGSRLESPSGTTYANVIIGIDDQGLWGASGATSTCFWNPDGDNVCDDEDFGSETRCGGVALTGSPFASGSVTVWVRTLAVDADLDVCGGTFGSLSANFF